jgi:hypothetical protein
MRMKALVLITLLATPAAFSADDPPVKVELELGQEKGLGNVTTPICDDPKVAVIAVDTGNMKAVGVGKTLCSARTLIGQRQVYEVVVTEPKKP